MEEETKILQAFGENLRKERTAKGVSQERMALDIGFDRTYISLLERGRRNPSLITMWKIARYLEIDAKDLVT